MFVASKILGFFALPTNFVICIGLFGIVLLFTRFARAGRRLMALSLILTAITPAGMSSMAARVERGLPQLSGVARSSRIGTKRIVKASPTTRS